MATKMSMADLQLVDHGGEGTQRVAVLDEPFKMTVGMRQYRFLRIMK